MPVDVARFGDDKTVLYHRQGPVVRLLSEHPKTATTESHLRPSSTGPFLANLGGGVVPREPPVVADLDGASSWPG